MRFRNFAICFFILLMVPTYHSTVEEKGVSKFSDGIFIEGQNIFKATLFRTDNYADNIMQRKNNNELIFRFRFDEANYPSLPCHLLSIFEYPHKWKRKKEINFFPIHKEDQGKEIVLMFVKDYEEDIFSNMNALTNQVLEFRVLCDPNFDQNDTPFATQFKVKFGLIKPKLLRFTKEYMEWKQYPLGTQLNRLPKSYDFSKFIAVPRDANRNYIGQRFKYCDSNNKTSLYYRVGYTTYEGKKYEERTFPDTTLSRVKFTKCNCIEPPNESNIYITEHGVDLEKWAQIPEGCDFFIDALPPSISESLNFNLRDKLFTENEKKSATTKPKLLKKLFLSCHGGDGKFTLYIIGAVYFNLKSEDHCLYSKPVPHALQNGKISFKS